MRRDPCLVVEIRFVLEKGKTPAQQHKGDDTRAPEVGLLSVPGAGEHLGVLTRAVVGRIRRVATRMPLEALG